MHATLGVDNCHSTHLNIHTFLCLVSEEPWKKAAGKPLFRAVILQVLVLTAHFAYVDLLIVFEGKTQILLRMRRGVVENVKFDLGR